MFFSRDYRCYELSTDEKERVLATVCKSLLLHEEICFAYAYGSFLEKGPFRDLDIAIYLGTDLSEPDFLYEDRLEQELLATLDVPFPIDIRVMNRAPIPFRYQAFRGELLFERDSNFRANLVAYVVSRYLDIRPILQHHMKEAFGLGH